MVKRKLKVRYSILLFLTLLIIPLFITMSSLESKIDIIEEEPDYITDEVIEESLPVVNTEIRTIPPYIAQNVKVARSYYDYQADETSQVNAISLHDNTYTQNTGIDYVADTPFEVVAILNGTVINVKNDEVLGKTVEVQHENGYISIYQSLKEVSVNIGDNISQGQILGMSGKNELEKDLENHLHFEIYDNGQSVNPLNYINKKIA